MATGGDRLDREGWPAMMAVAGGSVGRDEVARDDKEEGESLLGAEASQGECI